MCYIKGLSELCLKTHNGAPIHKQTTLKHPLTMHLNNFTVAFSAVLKMLLGCKCLSVCIFKFSIIYIFKFILSDYNLRHGLHIGIFIALSVFVCPCVTRKGMMNLLQVADL